MSNRKINVIVFLIVALVTSSCAGPEEAPDHPADYLGQSPPGKTPKIFAPGIISTDASELNCAFTPDLKEVYFTVRQDGVNTVMVVKMDGESWSERKVADFSGSFGDVDPFITSDGKRLYFSSQRPLDKKGESKDSDLLYVDRTEDGSWGSPVLLKELSSQGKDEYYTSIDKSGTLYFSIFETHDSPGDIYRAESQEGVYNQPERIDYSISTEFNEHDPFISPDGSYLIFASDRPEGMGRGDLYISFSTEDGSWTSPQNMGKTINTEGYEYAPLLSPDGKYLFFTRYTSGQGDIYWIDANVIEFFNPYEMKR
ncbi:TolB family protein [Acidobacteriota bacterium]